MFSHWLSTTVPLMATLTAVLLVALRWGREAFRHDYPPDIAPLLPEPTPTQRRVSNLLGAAFLVSLLGAVGWSSLVHLRGMTEPGFGTAYAITLVGMATFIAIDTLIVDWLVICWWRPNWVMIPGTESCEGWGDYGFHIRELLRPQAIAVNLLLPLPIAGVALWLS